MRDKLLIVKFYNDGSCLTRWYYAEAEQPSFCWCESLDSARKLADRLHLDGCLL